MAKWFGGKSRVSSDVWVALGDVDNYVEPFAGSLAVLLERPSEHTGTVETVNDLDHHLANFWRAVQHDPSEVAHYANGPVNEADLTARHIWLVNSGKERISRILGDPDFYDAKVAGWWVWGICAWIGGAWCAGTGPWGSVDGQFVNLREIDAEGGGVYRRRPHLGDAGRGVHRKRPQLAGCGGRGIGVNRLSIHRNAISAGTRTGEAELLTYINALAERLRYVRVCCGDWSRVVTRGALNNGSTVGIFLDPPYDVSMRDSGCYNTDAQHGDVSAAVREWCIENQDNPRYRIVLAGYDGEHDMPDGWRVVEWSAGASYQTANSNGGNSENRHKERLWFSPNCLGRDEPVQVALF